jgi:hypothetical protein
MGTAEERKSDGNRPAWQRESMTRSKVNAGSFYDTQYWWRVADKEKAR